MFEITPETRENLRKLFRESLNLDEVHWSDMKLDELIDEALVIVKRQFGF